MADRENVIKGLHEMSCRATWKDIDGIRNKFQPIINGALALLKEQPEIVRCKDCCMGEPYPREAGKTWCHLMSEPHKDDWFCADGTRKDGDPGGPDDLHG